MTDLHIGIDIGGTFTDFVVIHPESGEIDTFKVLSTPANPAEAVLSGLTRLSESYSGKVSEGQVNWVITHGSTVATNALLERKGVRTALITTRGFRDVLQIGRQNRPELYDLFVQPPPPLIAEELRFEVDERVDHTGRAIEALDVSRIGELIRMLDELNVESVAVCLLFSFLHPEHERELGRLLGSAGYSISLSTEILPEYREYERTSTTAVNAYVSPVLDRYLSALDASLSNSQMPARLRVMQSNGGNISIDEARRSGVRCILSGPAGGIVGSRFVARLGLQQEKGSSPVANNGSNLKVITFDMGGTSTDVSLIDRNPLVTTEAEIGGFPIKIPMLDIHTIGAGGGSIASVDRGGALRVGPESAGADPGPACYALGDPLEDQPTVTDANLVLGRLQADRFLGGEMPLDSQRAIQAISRLGEKLGLDPYTTARGVIEVVDAHMERALRVISIERGHDPRDFTLVSYGGSGGLHASDLAHRLGVPRILIPPLASTLSAFGMVVADVVKDYSKTVMLPGEVDAETIAEELKPLQEKGREELEKEGIPYSHISIAPSLDVRYRGQSFELTIPFERDFNAAFHRAHEEQYGYARRSSPTEIVNIRVRATGRAEPPQLNSFPVGGPDPSPAYLGHKPVHLTETPQDTPAYAGESLLAGNIIEGPAIVLREDTTILILSGDVARVDPYQNLHIAVSV